MKESLENHLEAWRLRAHDSSLGQFFRWWGAELRALLPAELRARMEHASRRLLLRVSGDELEVAVAEGGGRQVLDICPLDRDARIQQQQLRELLSERDLAEAPRVLLLDGAEILRKQVIMPSAAESNLRQALSFEMDRQTPFRAEDVYFDFHVVHRDREGGQLRVDLAVCPRSVIQARLEQINPRGLAPAAADLLVGDAPAGFNLLPPELRHRSANRRTRVNLLLAVVVALLLAFVMAQSLWLREHQVQLLEAAIQDVRVEAQRVQGIRSQIEDASQSAGFMVKQRRDTVPVVTVLAEVTRLLPDDTYLDRLRVWDGQVQLQGKSANAQQLIELVNSSRLLESASFKGPTRLDAASRKEIFDLTSNLTPGDDG